MFRQNHAQRTLRRFWRTQCVPTHVVVAAFTAFEERIPGLTFEAIVPFFTDAASVKTTKDFLRRVHATGYFLNPEHRELFQVETSINVRVFLAAYMIHHHPTKVLIDPTEPLTISLVAAADRMLQSLRPVLVSPCDKTLTRNFVVAMLDYVAVFADWKKPDLENLLARMKDALFALSIVEGESVQSNNTAQLTAVRRQMQDLRDKYRRHAGAEKLAELEAELQHPIHCDLVAIMHPVPKMKNEELAHEILLDPTFQLRIPPPTPTSQVLEASVWNKLRQDLRLLPYPCYGRLRIVLANFKKTLAGLVQDEEEGQEIIQTISTVLGLENVTALVQSNLQNHSQFFNEVFAVVLGVADRVHRQSRTLQADFVLQWNALRADPKDTLTDVIDSLAFFRRCLNILCVDTGNQRMRRVAPDGRAAGVQYLRHTFKVKVDSGDIQVDRCIQPWIQAATVTLPLSATVKQVHTHALLTLIASGQEQEIPETLCFDEGRLRHIRKLFSFVVASTVLLNAVIPARRALRYSMQDPGSEAVSSASIIQELAREIKRISDSNFDSSMSLLDGLLVVAAEAVNYAVYTHGNPALVSVEFMHFFGAYFRRVLHVDHPDYKTAHQQVWRYLEARLLGGSPDVTPFHYIVCHILRPAADTLVNIANLNLSVHSERYQALIAQPPTAMG